MSSIEPISPEEVVGVKLTTIPDKVMKAFNDLIGEKWDGSRSRILMKEVRTRIGGTIKKEWLDIEPIFRDKGWDVKYDSPVYDENFDAYYEFKKKK